MKCQVKFLSTLSLRRATLELFLFYQDNRISIHALLAESDREAYRQASLSHRISIHALLAESDLLQRSLSAQGRNFYPRSPCGERQITSKLCNLLINISIHALLAESDGIHFVHLHKNMNNFYPRSPCGERHIAANLYTTQRNFYPRSPCGERLSALYASWPRALFLSTLSLRRATQGADPCRQKRGISIHALLAESD